MSTYLPEPADVSNVELAEDLVGLTEALARNAHDVWASMRIADGWTWGPSRDDAARTHPCLVPYDDLPESEKQYDRATAMGTLKTIVALGYRIEPARR